MPDLTFELWYLNIKMILFLYNILFTFFLFLYAPYFFLRSLFQKRLRKLLAHRMGSIPNLQSKRPVWIHAASVGEVICSIPLFKKIKEEFPGCSHSSDDHDPNRKQYGRESSSRRQMGSSFFPLTTPSSSGGQSEESGPASSSSQRQNSGPISSASVERRTFPFLLFNGRISKKSLKGYLLFKSLVQRLLEIHHPLSHADGGGSKPDHRDRRPS